jgi:HAD superfamily hydrolase (TIGR01509 family)
MFKAVIFDLDGTLIDSMGIWAEVDIEFLNKRNIPIPEDLFADMPEGNSFNDLAIYFKEKFSLEEDLETIKNEWHEMVEEYYSKKIGLKENVLKVLDLLREKNIPMAIGTSNSEYLTEKVLEFNQIKDYFRYLSCGCHDIKGKPFPDIFLRAAEELKVSKEHCLVLEDTLYGVQAAKNAQMRVYAMFDKYSLHEQAEIKKHSDQFFRNFNELYNYLRDVL